MKTNIKKLVSAFFVCIFCIENILSVNVYSYYLSPPVIPLDLNLSIQSMKEKILKKAHDNISKKSNVYVKVSLTKQAMGEIEAQDAGKAIRKLIKEKGRAVVVLAAAPSQDEFLDELAKQRNIDWTKIIFFHLDEYLDLPRGHKNTFEVYLNDHFFSKLPVPLEDLTVYFIKDQKGTPEEICAQYSDLICREGGIDLAFIGEGENSHIAFNDPGALFNDTELVRVAIMDEMSRWQQYHDYKNDPDPEKRYKSINDVPRKAITLTIPALLAADKIFCSVPKSSMRFGVRSSVLGPVSHAYPASILKKHKYTRLYFDRDSANLLGIKFKGKKTHSFRIPKEPSLLNIKKLQKLVHTRAYPQNEKGIVIDYNGEADMSTLGTVMTLQVLGNSIHKLTIDKESFDVEMVQYIAEEIKDVNPGFIFIPHASDKRLNVQIVRAMLLKALQELSDVTNKDIRIFEYQTTGDVAGDNLTCVLDEKAHNTVEDSANQFQSQLPRLRFDIAKDLAMRSWMTILRSLGLIPSDMEGLYVESFDISYCTNGELMRPDGRYFVGNKRPSDVFQVLSFKDGHAVLLAPHYDDMIFSAGGLLSFLKQQNCVVQPVYLTTGHRAVMVDEKGKIMFNKIHKIAARELEVGQALKVSGIRTKPIFLRLPFYDNTNAETGERIVTERERTRVYGVISEQYFTYAKREHRTTPFSVFLPSEDDPHPDHIATRAIGMEAVKRISQENHIQILVVSYRSPWPGKYNSLSYIDDKTYDKKMQRLKNLHLKQIGLLSDARNAIIGTEMVSLEGYGTTPVKAGHLGSGSAELFYEWLIRPHHEPYTKVKPYILIPDQGHAPATPVLSTSDEKASQLLSQAN